MSVSTTIDSALGVVSVLTTGTPSLAISENAVFTGAVDFTAATVSGITSNPNVLVITDPSLTTPESYDLTGGVRVIRASAAPVGNWTISVLTGLSLPAGQATTIKVLCATASDRTVTLTGMTVEGVAATVNPATVKAKQKGSGIALDVVNSGGSYFVFGSSLASE